VNGGHCSNSDTLRAFTELERLGVLRAALSADLNKCVMRIAENKQDTQPGRTGAAFISMGCGVCFGLGELLEDCPGQRCVVQSSYRAQRHWMYDGTEVVVV
jgi:hypothetical protein